MYIEIFNGQRNNASKTTKISTLCNFEETKKFLCHKNNPPCLHVFIQGTTKLSFRPLLPTLKINNNSKSIETINHSTLLTNTSKSNPMVNAQDIDKVDPSDENECKNKSINQQLPTS